MCVWTKKMKHLLEAYFSYLEKSPNKNFLLFLTTWLVIQISYWGFSLPYYFIIKSKALEKYKIQPKVAWTEEEKKKAFKAVAFNIGLLTLLLPAGPLLFGLIPFPKLTPLPSWKSLALQVFGCQVIEDFTFYWSHRLLHAVPSLYKKYHKQHHEFTSPFAWTAAYAHPVDFLLGNVVPASAPILVMFPHPLVIWTWLVLRLWYTTDVHCGYKFPWGLERFLGFVYAGPRHHDFHHQNFTGNFSSTLRYLDQIFGTETGGHSKIDNPKKEE